MSADPQTWHHGLVAAWWGEFNDDFRAHEIPYFERFVAEGGGPALDAGCGTGRLLRPYLRSGLEVDGCDKSADMIAVCREKAAAEGLRPDLYVQALDQLDLPRRYRTIYVCGTFGLGSDRRRDAHALERLRDHLEPGGTLLVDMEVPWADARLWHLWPREARAALPESASPPGKRRRASDGTDYAMSSRVVDLEPLRQRITLEMRAERWRGDELLGAEEHTLHINLYFVPEVRAMLEAAGFGHVEVHGEHERRPATGDDDFVVFVARR